MSKLTIVKLLNYGLNLLAVAFVVFVCWVVITIFNDGVVVREKNVECPQTSSLSNQGDLQHRFKFI